MISTTTDASMSPYSQPFAGKRARSTGVVRCCKYQLPPACGLSPLQLDAEITRTTCGADETRPTTHGRRGMTFSLRWLTVLTTKRQVSTRRWDFRISSGGGATWNTYVDLAQPRWLYRFGRIPRVAGTTRRRRIECRVQLNFEAADTAGAVTSNKRYFGAE